MARSHSPTPRTRTLRRTWTLRALAVLIGLSPFLVAESLLRALDLGRPDVASDPFVGFSELWPLFTLDRETGQYAIAPAHSKFFRPASFAAVKPRGEFRIFCLGGSTVQGRPFATETAFAAWLGIGLNALDPSRRWKTVNCGGVSYASYRLVHVLREVLRDEPDLIVLYTGHNEFLEARSYAAVKRLPGAVKRPLELASRLRTFRVLRSALGVSTAPPAPRTLLGPEVDALLDYRGGLEAYHRDDAQRAATIAHYEWNLRRMIALCRAAGVPVVLINPVANLDTPPFKSEARADLSPAQRARFAALWDEARHRYRDDLAAAATLLEQARAIDGRHAGLHYALGQCYEALGRHDDARRSLERARDEDVCPLRILGPMRQVVRRVARDTGTPLLDAEPLFATRNDAGFPGDDWLVDHVHPSIAGHRVLADALIDLLAREGIAHPDATRLAERDRRWREHLAGLDEAYYLIGQKRLGNLRMWAEGRGNREPKRRVPPSQERVVPDSPAPSEHSGERAVGGSG